MTFPHDKYSQWVSRDFYRMGLLLLEAKQLLPFYFEPSLQMLLNLPRNCTRILLYGFSDIIKTAHNDIESSNFLSEWHASKNGTQIFDT